MPWSGSPTSHRSAARIGRDACSTVVVDVVGGAQGNLSVASVRGGYEQLTQWAAQFGQALGFSVEGAGLASHLLRHGLYMIDGNACTYADSTTTTPTNPNGNTYITRIDWNTGSVGDRQLTKAGQSLHHREPEGLALQIPDTSNTAARRLVMGFASESSATDTNKMASLCYKSTLI